MAYILDSARKLADVYAEVAFGETYTNLLAQHKAETAQHKAKMTEHKAETAQHKAIILNAVIQFYTKSKLSVEEIAEAMQLETKFVRKVLKSKNLL